MDVMFSPISVYLTAEMHKKALNTFVENSLKGCGQGQGGTH